MAIKAHSLAHQVSARRTEVSNGPETTPSPGCWGFYGMAGDWGKVTKRVLGWEPNREWGQGEERGYEGQLSLSQAPSSHTLILLSTPSDALKP